MTAVLMTRTLNGLAAADEEASAVLRKVPVGNVVKVDVVRPRNLSAHRRYWALVNLIFSNSDAYASPDVVHGHLKILAGCATPVVNKSTGETYLIPGSISFSSMDEGEFQEFWNRCTKAVAEHILPGITVPELEAEVANIIGAGAFR